MTRTPSPGAHGLDATEDDEPKFKPLTREQAQQLRQDSPSISVWAVLVGQLLAGLLAAGVAWGFTGKSQVALSVMYGAMAVVIPGAIFARGLTSRVASINAGAAVAGFFLWEMVKIGLTIAMLFAAPRWIENLSWPAMLAGLIVTMKVVWVVLWLKSARRPGH